MKAKIDDHEYFPLADNMIMFMAILPKLNKD